MSTTEVDRIADLVARFLSAEVPASEWTHRAHVTVGTALVHQHGPEQALTIMREGILRLNRAHGTPETPTRGYHETITRAYLVLIARLLSGLPAADLAHRVAAAVEGPLGSREVLLGYYSRDRLMSLEARQQWQPPDLRPLEP